MLELVQIIQVQDRYKLETVFVNPKHIVRLSENRHYSEILREGKINLELNPITTFTNIILNEGDRSSSLVVVGDPSIIESKLNKSFGKRTILKG